MPIKISIGQPSFIGDLSTLAFGSFRVSETLSVPGTSTISALKGEIAIVVSTETASVIAADGLVPDAAATVATADTSAGYAIPPGIPFPVALQAGGKINVKAFA